MTLCTRMPRPTLASESLASAGLVQWAWCKDAGHFGHSYDTDVFYTIPRLADLSLSV